VFQVSMFLLCLEKRCPCGIRSAPFALHGVTKVLPQEDPMTKMTKGRSVSVPCMRPLSCPCSSCKSLPTRIGPGPWSSPPCREGQQASGFVVLVLVLLDFARGGQLERQLSACQTKGSPSASPKRHPLTRAQNACSRPREMRSVLADCGTRRLPNRTSRQPRCYLACSGTSGSCLGHNQARIGSHGKTSSLQSATPGHF